MPRRGETIGGKSSLRAGGVDAKLNESFVKPEVANKSEKSLFAVFNVFKKSKSVVTQVKF